MRRQFHRALPRTVGYCVQFNLLLFALGGVHFLRTGQCEQFVVILVSISASFAIYLVVRHKPKTVISLTKDSVIINDGYSIPAVGELLRSDIRQIIRRTDGIVEIERRDGKVAMFDSNQLSKSDRRELGRLLETWLEERESIDGPRNR